MSNDTAERGHHVFCNYWLRPAKDCHFCNDSDKGFWAKYPYEPTNDENEVFTALVKKHFPSAIVRR